MRIAVPLVDGVCCEDFGYCDCIALVDVDDQTRLIIARNDVGIMRPSSYPKTALTSFSV